MPNIIFASTARGGIGLNNQLPWRCPEDFAIFKALTNGQSIIMGAKTWDSLPRRPLPGRFNIVVTSDASRHPGADAYAKSLDSALDTYSTLPVQRGSTKWVIGGQRIIEEAYPIAAYVHHTLIHPHWEHGEYECDTFVQLPPEGYLAIDELMVESTSGMRITHTTYHHETKPTDPDYEDSTRLRIREALRVGTQ